MTKRYSVFVSSTYEDLQAERLAVVGGLLENNCIPLAMEQFPAISMNQWDYIKRLIDESDYYILIVAGKYGSIDSETGISYTEKEFDYAQSKNVPVMAFLHKDIDNIVGSKLEKSERKRKMLLNFRKKLTNGRLVKFYSSIDELKAHVVTSINSAIKLTPRPGWIRADNENSIDNEQFDEMLAERTATDDDIYEIFRPPDTIVKPVKKNKPNDEEEPF